MPHNILITGAAGYIGGSVLTTLLNQPIPNTTLFAAVRSKEQVDALSKTAAKVLQLDISDNAAVNKAVEANQIDMIVHTASSFNIEIVGGLIRALGERQKQSGKQSYFIHSSVAPMFTPEGGWPTGHIKDSDPDLFEKEKKVHAEQPGNPVRETNQLVAELSEKLGVRSYNVVLPNVYGRGTGEWRKLSVKFPALLRVAMKDRTLYKYHKDSYEASVHISDLTQLYCLLIQQSLSGAEIPSGNKGYFFAFSHHAPMWKTLDRLASILHSQGSVDDSKAGVWESDKHAAEKLGFPEAHIGTMLGNSGEMIAVSAYKLDWKPEWDEEKFLENLGDEVKDVREVDTVETTLFQGATGL